MFWRPIFLVNGILLCIIAGVMLIAMTADIVTGHENWKVFAISSLITLFVGMSLYLSNRGTNTEGIRVRQAFLITATSYIVITFFGALPFYLSKDVNMPLYDAYFETASGITTTGASVMSGLDFAPKGILLWRALLNGLGGIGIVVMALAVLPMLRIGGMQLFKTESSENSDKMLPRTPQIALAITAIFSSLTLLCYWCFWLAGMSSFDAICHAIATIATGGFSTHDRSLGFYDSVSIEMITIFFMILGSLPLMLYYKTVKGNWWCLYRDPQVRVFLMIIIVTTLLISTWLVITKDMNLFSALRYSSFNIVSIISTTGFSSADYMQWGSMAIMTLFMLTVVGGCTGSTAGGIKVFRFIVFYKTVNAQLQQLIQPHGVFIPRFDGKPIHEDVVASVTTFLLLFATVFLVSSILLSMFGLDFITSLSSTAQALANVGLGLGDIVGPTGNYQPLPQGAKWVLSFVMIMGRLELFTIIVLFTPKFWSD
jgi:trk system potassium uptake protein